MAAGKSGQSRNERKGEQAMKQIQVRKVPYGETFSVFGDKFVALDYINGKVLAIRKEIWKNADDEQGRLFFFCKICQRKQLV